ncbi:MAG: hypothetical protein ACRD10_10530 [Terriglobia bacterium]
MKAILNAVVVILVIVWLMQVFGLMEPVSRIRVGR